MKRLKENIGNIIPFEERLKNADILSILKRNIKEETNWSFFESYFSNANPNFMMFLSRKYPLLTANDMRLIALIRLNLSSSGI